MKGLKRLIAVASAVVLAVVLAAPALANQTYTVTINNAKSGHTYEAYQIFKGDLSEDEGVLSNIQWGSGVSDTGKVNLGEASSKAKTLEMVDAAEEFAQEVGAYLTSPAATVTAKQGEACTLTGLPAGYYLIKHQDDSLSDDNAYTAFILKVVGDVAVVPKSAQPTVDKLVLDEQADAEAGAASGWGETADHAINETFQFKLVATLPQDDNFDFYSSYKVVFNDTMSDGVTFDSIKRVKVNNVELKSSEYVFAPADEQSDIDWTLTIADVTTFDNDLTDGATIEVIYNAHLNENAASGGTAVNKNAVFLQYSNNPNVAGAGQNESLGKTEKDEVWVFTYALNNTKVDDTINGPALSGAGFRLYTDEACKNEVSLIYEASKSAYRPIAAGEEGIEMLSAESGEFNIIGLDAGTYYLRETTTPDGYNTCADIKVVISATHSELADGTAASNVVMTVNGANATENVVVNERGVALPSTGGMGTAMFYVVGSVLLLGSCALLIARRRADSD